MSTRAERTLRATQGVLDTGCVRLRWIGHRLHAEAEITVSGGITAIEAHRVAVSAEHALLHALPGRASMTTRRSRRTAWSALARIYPGGPARTSYSAVAWALARDAP